jgi:acyl-CoA hydrolase
MELRGSKTEEHLRTAFANELRARVSYTHFAAAAREEGFEQIADLLLATAKNEAEHADQEFQLFREIADVRSNLQRLIELERIEAQKIYPEAAKTAAEEGFGEIAEFFRKVNRAEERHEKNLREVLEALERGDAPQGRTVLHSAVDMAQVMLPGQANPAGFVHGGELMKLMDNAAGVAAVRHCHSNVVTATVEEINFLHPVRIGSLVLVRAVLTFVGSSSMEVRVEVDTEDLSTESRNRAVTAHFVMIALDRDRKPTGVPPLLVCTEEEEELFHEGRARYEARKSVHANRRDP